MDGTALTYRKTAADSALGSLLLSREDARVLLMVGGGGLAPYLARAHLAIRPSLAARAGLEPSPARAEATGGDAARAKASTRRRPIDLEAAVRAADIVSCSTASTDAAGRGDWLKPGAHLDLVGGFTPAMRECDDDGRRRGTAVRRRGQHRPRSACGDLIDPIRRGVIKRGPSVEGDLFDLCRPALALDRAPGDITLFKNGGGGHLDLFTALYICDRCAKRPT